MGFHRNAYLERYIEVINEAFTWDTSFITFLQ
jgi:hypothetical protein